MNLYDTDRDVLPVAYKSQRWSNVNSLAGVTAITASDIVAYFQPPPALTVLITDDEAVGATSLAATSNTFEFSETVTGFDDADITVVNGTPAMSTAALWLTPTRWR